MNIIKKRINYHFKQHKLTQNKQNCVLCIMIRTNYKCGICSYAHQYLNAAFKVMQNGYIPIIDMKNGFYYQFHDKKNRDKNVWNDYFKQPFALDNFQKFIKYKFCSSFDLDSAPTISQKSISKTFLTPSSSVQNLIDEYLKKIIIDKTLGILIRGGLYF